MKSLNERIEDYKKLINESSDLEEDLCNREKCEECAHNPAKITCCNCCPCELSPADLVKVDKETIEGLLKTGLVVIDFWEGDLDECGYDYYGEIPYLRFRSIGETTPVSRGWGGRCVALDKDKGCLIDFKVRPYFARHMVNCQTDAFAKEKSYDSDNRKHMISSKLESVIQWRPYKDLLDSLIFKYAPVGFDSTLEHLMDINIFDNRTLRVSNPEIADSIYTKKLFDNIELCEKAIKE